MIHDYILYCDILYILYYVIYYILLYILLIYIIVGYTSCYIGQCWHWLWTAMYISHSVHWILQLFLTFFSKFRPHELMYSFPEKIAGWMNECGIYPPWPHLLLVLLFVPLYFFLPPFSLSYSCRLPWSSTLTWSGTGTGNSCDVWVLGSSRTCQHTRQQQP